MSLLCPEPHVNGICTVSGFPRSAVGLRIPRCHACQCLNTASESADWIALQMLSVWSMMSNSHRNILGLTLAEESTCFVGYTQEGLAGYLVRVCLT